MGDRRNISAGIAFILCTPPPMHLSSAVLASRNQFRHMPVAYLSVLLLLLGSVVLSALSMHARECGSRGGFATGAAAGIVCFRGATVRIRISSTGELFLHDQRIAFDQLAYHAAALRARDESTIVIVSAAAGTQLTKVVNVFKVLQRQHVRYMVETAFVER